MTPKDLADFFNQPLAIPVFKDEADKQAYIEHCQEDLSLQTSEDWELPPSEMSDEEKRQRRLERCGKVFHQKLDPYTGVWNQVVERCKLRECPQCAEMKKIGTMRDLQEIEEDFGPLQYVVVSDSDSKSILQKLQKRGVTDYGRYPVGNNQAGILFPVEQGDSIGSLKLDFIPFATNTLSDNNIEELTFAPPQKRRAGEFINYRKKKKQRRQEQNKNLIEIEYIDVCLNKENAQKEAVTQAKYKAIKDTSDEVVTGNNIQEAMDKRTQAYLNWLNILNVHVDSKMKKTTHIDPKDINWVTIDEIRSITITNKQALSPDIKSFVALNRPPD